VDHRSFFPQPRRDRGIGIVQQKPSFRPADREVCDVAGSGASDIGTDDRQELDAVAGAHHLAAGYVPNRQFLSIPFRSELIHSFA
jgi:hypothetical protein